MVNIFPVDWAFPEATNTASECRATKKLKLVQKRYSYNFRMVNISSVPWAFRMLRTRHRNAMLRFCQNFLKQLNFPKTQYLDSGHFVYLVLTFFYTSLVLFDIVLIEFLPHTLTSIKNMWDFHPAIE